MLEELAAFSLYDAWMWWVHAPFWISIPAGFAVALAVTLGWLFILVKIGDSVE